MNICSLYDFIENSETRGYIRTMQATRMEEEGGTRMAGGSAASTADGRALHDNWYQVDPLDKRTYVIHEPRYYQKNNVFLLIGTDRALLFDSGSGKRTIAPLIRQLTHLPIILFNSHAHFDHIGNNHEFKHIALTDLPINREQMKNNLFTPHWRLRLSFKRYSFPIQEWYKAGQTIDLGNRKLHVIPLPGHSADHAGLLDEENGYFFVADALYHGPLVANLPTAHIPDYARSAQAMIDIYAGHKILGSHFLPAPFMGQRHLLDLKAACGQALGSPRSWVNRLKPFLLFKHGTVTLQVSHAALKERDRGPAPA